MFASDRNIVAGITDGYARCDQALDNVTTPNFDDIQGTFAEIEERVNGAEMLDSINKTALRGNLRALFLTQRDYLGEIDEEEASRHVCGGRLRNFFSGDQCTEEILSIIEEEAAAFRSMQRPPPTKNIADTIETLKGLGARLNGMCENARRALEGDSYRCANTNRARCVIYRTHAVTRWEETQREMQQAIDTFDPAMKRFMVTDHFQDDVMPFGEDVAEKCAKGDLHQVFNTNLSTRDIRQSAGEFADIVLDELKDVQGRQRDIARQNDSAIYNEIKDVLKHRPYLTGDYLAQFANDDEELENTANYICKATLDIYETDRFWNVAEVAVGRSRPRHRPRSPRGGTFPG